MDLFRFIFKTNTKNPLRSVPHLLSIMKLQWLLQYEHICEGLWEGKERGDLRWGKGSLFLVSHIWNTVLCTIFFFSVLFSSSGVEDLGMVALFSLRQHMLLE